MFCPSLAVPPKGHPAGESGAGASRHRLQTAVVDVFVFIANPAASIVVTQGVAETYGGRQPCRRLNLSPEICSLIVAARGRPIEHRR